MKAGRHVGHFSREVLDVFEIAFHGNEGHIVAVVVLALWWPPAITSTLSFSVDWDC